jgi:GxxExxY protein
MNLSKKSQITQAYGDLFKKEGYELMAAAFEVHNEVGGGLAEEVYQESLEKELRIRGIPFSAKQEISLYYKGIELQRRYIPDLYVHDGIIVELKAVSKLLPEHESQLSNYMRLTGKRVGYLINLAPLKTVEWRRFAL